MSDLKEEIIPNVSKSVVAPKLICIGCNGFYREAQLNFTPEIKVLYMLFDRCHTKNRKRSFKQHIKYLNFRCKIQLDLPVKRSGALLLE